MENSYVIRKSYEKVQSQAMQYMEGRTADKSKIVENITVSSSWVQKEEKRTGWKKKKHDNLKSTKSEPECGKQECHTSSHSKEKQQLTLP